MIPRDITATLELSTGGDLRILTEAEAVEEALKNLMFNEIGDDIMSPKSGSVAHIMLHEDLTNENAFILRRMIIDSLSYGAGEVPASNIGVNVDIDEFAEAFLPEVSYEYDGNRYSFKESINV